MLITRASFSPVFLTYVCTCTCMLCAMDSSTLNLSAMDSSDMDSSAIGVGVAVLVGKCMQGPCRLEIFASTPGSPGPNGSLYNM